MVSKKVIVGGVAAIIVIGGVTAGLMNSGSTSKDKKDSFSVAMVTSETGIDDESFNQSAWGGLQAYGKDNKLSKGTNGYDYFQSKSQADFIPNFSQAVTAKFDMVAGIGYNLHQATVTTAEKNPKTKFVLIDDVDTKKTKNVASVMFRSEQSSYLVGVASAKKAQELGQHKVAFIGGMKGNIIDAFEAGYTAGVKSVDPTMEVDVRYADSFSDAAKGQMLTNALIANNEHVIFQAAGAVGKGVFTEAKAVNSKLPNDSKDKVYVSGVDMDQTAMGDYKDVNGKKSNFVLTNSLTNVGQGLKLIAEQSKRGNFPGGKVTSYDLEDGGVGITTKGLNAEEKAATDKAKQAIEDGKVKVPNHPAGSEYNQNF